MMSLNEILKNAIEKKCSDVYLSVGTKIFGRINSKLQVIVDEILTQQDTMQYAEEILLNKFQELDENGDMDKSFSISGLGRFRANVFKQRNSIAIVIKIISFNSFEYDEKFFIPSKVYEFVCNVKQGLVLVTGPVGSGKSTTISSIIGKISKDYSKHIVSIESSIEILYKHNNSIVNQREIGNDTKTYLSGIEATFKEKPDILVVDNIENYDILKLILKCCEAGMLVISSIYANSVKSTIATIMEMDSKNTGYFRNNFSNVLKCIINQKIILDNENKKMCLFEIMINTPSISNCIKENKINHILPLMQNGLKLGMCTLDMSLVEAYKMCKISKSTFLQNISNREFATKIILNY